jgi:hypothetical protein
VREIKGATQELLAKLPVFQEAVGRVQNRAVFEVVTALEKIIDSSQMA